MRNTVFIAIIFSLTHSISFGQTFEWAVQMADTGGYTGGPVIALSVDVDSQGNVYTVGTFAMEIDLDPGIGTQFRQSNGGMDVFVQKLDSSGNYLWSRTYGGSGNESASITAPPYQSVIKSGLSSAIDQSGNLYITGTYHDSVDFDPGIGTYTLNSAGNTDFYILKLNSTGDFEWAHSFGGTGFDAGHDIIIDNNGDVVVTGRFGGGVDFNPSPLSTFNLSPSSSVYVLKLDENGDFIWAVGTEGSSGYLKMAIDDMDNIFVAGKFENSVNIHPGSDTLILSGNGIFQMKLDNDGIFQWGRALEEQYFEAITTDGEGNLYTTGGSLGHMFIEKLDANGDSLWLKHISGSYPRGRGVQITDSGDLLCMGQFRYSMDFNPDGDPSILESGILGSSYDLFIMNLDSDGQFNWVKQVGSQYGKLGYDLRLNSNQLYCVGQFRGITDFDPESTDFYINGQSNMNGFLFKWDLESIPVATDQENTFINTPSLYPNPSTSELNIAVSEFPAEILIYDSYGRLIKSLLLSSTGKTIDVSNFTSGIYTAVTKRGNSISAIQFSVQK